MRVGAVEETLTVTGASPIVDTRNVRTQNVISRELLDTLPTGKSTQAYIAVTVGAWAAPSTQDVGGNRGETGAHMAIHGGRQSDAKLLYDGMGYNHALGPSGGGFRFYNPNQAAAQEIVLETGGISAQSETAGIQMNLVPKDGGNTLRSALYMNGTGPALQGTNLTDDLQSRGLTTTPGVKKIYDVGGDVGGPIKRDKLWFYTALRWWNAEEFVPGNYFDKSPTMFPETLFYVPDESRPAYLSIPNQDYTFRMLWQATLKNKFSFLQSLQNNCYCFNFVNNNHAPEASTRARYYPEGISQVTWTYPATERVLLQAGATYNINDFSNLRPEEQEPNAIPITELSTGYVYNSRAGMGYNDYAEHKRGDQVNGRFSASYVTGSHAFKTGLYFYVGGYNQKVTLNEPPISYEFLKPTAEALPKPVSVAYWASPNSILSMVQNLGLYAQDQWSVGRFTVNVGVRMDYLRAWNPEQTKPGGTFVPELHIERMDDVPNWKDLSPRLGLSYDVFGNGKTAIKGSLGRYVLGEGTTIAFATNPAGAIVTNAKRAWSDNGDYVPQESELGALSNALFGTVQINTHYADEVLRGFMVRPYTWQGTAAVQHELRSGLGLTVGYFRTSYGNYTVVDNIALTPSSFDSFCVTAPTDARLPGGGGNRICGLYDVTPAEFGRVDNLVRPASDYGSPSEVYNGVDVIINARLRNGIGIAGGFNTGRTVIDNCYQNDQPQLVAPVLPNYTSVPPGGGGQGSGMTPRLPEFCRAILPFKGQTQIKLNGFFPLPWELAGSVVFQNLSGIPIAAGQSFTNSQIVPELGRNLAACGTTTNCTAAVAINLLPPYQNFENRLTQVDLRLTKTMRFGRTRLQGTFDVYNAFNAATILVRNDTFGPRWGRPNQVLAARLVKLGAQFDF